MRVLVAVASHSNGEASAKIFKKFPSLLKVIVSELPSNNGGGEAIPNPRCLQDS
jgi:hypothetical protein